jgi:hypothetical protein
VTFAAAGSVAGDEAATWYFTDGTTTTAKGNITHTFSPSIPNANGGEAVLLDPDQLTYVRFVTQGTRQLKIPATAPRLVTLQAYNNLAQHPVTTSRLWTNLVTVDVSNNGISHEDFRLRPEWTKLQSLSISGNPWKALTIEKTWTALAKVYSRSCQLSGTLEFDSVAHANVDYIYSGNNRSLQHAIVPATLTKLTWIYFDSCDLQEFATHAEWTNLLQLAVNYNPDLGAGGGLTTRATWTKLTRIYANQSGLTSFEYHQEWTAMQQCYVYSNQLPASEIDAILIEADASGVVNGLLHYSGNPGAPDASRSAPALAAKASLIAKGWTITIA